MDDRNWDSSAAIHSDIPAGRSTSNYPTPLSPAPPVSQSSRKQRASHTIQSSSAAQAQQTAQPASSVIDVYAHPAAVAYAAAHPRRSIPKFGPYLLLQTLGEGEFGKVKLGLHGQWGEEVAVKLIRRENVDSTLRMSKVEREIEVLRHINHPNIVRLYDVIETDKYIGIILEYASGGELFDHILAHRYLREKDASKLFAQLISGVSYIHAKKIVHRDLKLENLLLDRNRNVIITDFGFANRFEHKADDLMQTSCGSPCYAAPELVISEGLYVGSAVDIWSCGVILYAMLAGYLPFDDDPANPDGDNINLLYKYIINTPLTFPDYVSAEARDLLSKMLVPDPTKRADLRIIMAHSWLSNYRHLFERSVEEVERIASENQMAKRMAYQRQMKANKDREAAEAKMARSQSVRPDPSRGGKDYVYETAEPGQTTSRRVAASAIVMPTSAPMHDDPFNSVPSPVEEQQLAAPDSHRSRKESSRSKKSTRSTRKESSSKAAAPPTPTTATATPKEKKKGGYRHTIQLEYDDGEPQQTPSRSSRSHHHRHHGQETASANGHANVEVEDQNTTPRKSGRPSEPPPPLPTPPQNVTLTPKHSPTPAPPAPLDVSPASPTTPTASNTKVSPPISPSSTRSRTASSPTYVRASATEPAIPTLANKREEIVPPMPSPPLPIPPAEETPSLTSDTSATSATPASSTVMTSDASHHSTGSSNKSTRHRKGMSMDKFNLGKLLSGSSKDSGLHGKDTSAGHPIISGPYNIRKASEGEKLRMASEGGSTDHSASGSPGVRSKSSTLGPSEGEKLAEAVEGVPEGSLKSKRKSGRKTLSLMVEPFGRSLKDRSKARSVTADSGKSIDPSQPPSTAPLPPAHSSKPPPAPSASAHVKTSSSHQAPPPTPSNWRIPLFREKSSSSAMQAGHIEDPIAVVAAPVGSDIPTMASRGSTTKSQKVMDWFRMKSLAKRNSETLAPAHPPPPSDEPTTPTLDTYHVVNDRGSSSTVHQSNSSQTPAVVVTGAELSPTPDGSIAGSTNSRASKGHLGTATPTTTAPAVPFNVKVLRVHHGAVDQDTVTTGFPPEVFAHVTKVLIDMGVDIQKESEFKYRCIRPKKKKDANGHRESTGLTAFTMMGSAASNGVDKRGLPLPSHGSFTSGGILKGMFTRRQSSQVHPSSHSTALPSPAISLESGDSTPGEGGAFSPPDSSLGHPEAVAVPPGPIYGDRTADQADEVRFSVELTRIDRLEGTYSLDIRRLKGNLRSYKFLYDTLRERCDFR